ncbi:MAG: DUF1761 domain-containing protein [Balneolaceae bacterium]|nr:DUF1761 domain-containing protein [Balneolaceae bacterium]
MADLLAEFNWLAAVVGGIAYFAIGALWYGPFFGKAWREEKEIDELPESPGAPIFVQSLLLQIVAAVSLGIFAVALAVDGAVEGFYLGLAASAGFVATTVGVNGIYNEMSLRLFFIDAGYHVVGFAAAGLIIGMW